MRDRVKPPHGPDGPRAPDEFESFLAPRLNPADGLEASASLFTAPPIESLELLRELGEIAAASLDAVRDGIGPAEPASAAPAEASIPRPEISPATEAARPGPTDAPKAKAPAHSDDRLLEALLEYHRLRGPKLGARTAPRPTGSAPTAAAPAPAREPAPAGFTSVEIPVVADVVPKTSSVGVRASRPIQTILKPKPRA